MVSAKPPPGALHELIGSGGTKTWGHVSSCRGRRLGGRAVLAHVGCFRLCVLCCGHEQPFRATNTTYLVES